MKKIRKIKELNLEKNKLLQRQADLQKAIRQDWEDLKDDFTPEHLIDAACRKTKTEKNGFFSNAFKSLAPVVLKKMIARTREKFTGWFN